MPWGHASAQYQRLLLQVVLAPERVLNYAVVKGAGWGYVGSVLGGAKDVVLKGDNNYWEIIIEENGWGCMIGCADPKNYSPTDGGKPGCDTPHGWFYYTNNGRYFHNKKPVGETGQIARAGDVIGILYRTRAARKPAFYDARMGTVTGQEGYLTFFRNGQELPGGHTGVAEYDVTTIQGLEGGSTITTATPRAVVPCVDFYSAARLKINRGNLQDRYIQQLQELAFKPDDARKAPDLPKQ